MGSIAPQLGTGLCPRAAAGRSSPNISARRRGHRVAVFTVTGQARFGRVTADVAAGPKNFLLPGFAIAAAEINCSTDQRAPSIDRSNLQVSSTTRKDKYFEVEMTVCDDELDPYGVVNNAIYASYIHKGRDLLLEYLGISVDYWASTGNAMALSELNLMYYAPLKSGDRFVVKVRPVQIKGVRMVMHHLIETLPDRKLGVDARGTIVFLNKDYRPTRVFPEVAAKAWEMFACRED